jgi:hypothetical protein
VQLETVNFPISGPETRKIAASRCCAATLEVGDGRWENGGASALGCGFNACKKGNTLKDDKGKALHTRSHVF